MIPNQLYTAVKLQKNNNSNEYVFNVLIFAKVFKKLQRTITEELQFPFAPWILRMRVTQRQQSVCGVVTWRQ